MARNKKTVQEEVVVTSTRESDYSVILRPVITEKSMKLLEQENKVTVKVAKDANAIAIKNAFESLFHVKVVKVNIANVRAKSKRVGRYVGTLGAYKKAIVKLAEGQAIDLFKSGDVQ